MSNKDYVRVALRPGNDRPFWLASREGGRLYDPSDPDNMPRGGFSIPRDLFEDDAVSAKASNSPPKFQRVDNDDSGLTVDERADAIVQAWKEFPHGNDDYWNKDGRPAVDMFSHILGFETTRAEMDNAFYNAEIKAFRNEAYIQETPDKPESGEQDAEEEAPAEE